MAKSLFDPVNLLNEDLAENATKTVPLPEGEPLAQVTKLDFANGEKDGREWTRLDVRLEIIDQDYLAGYPSEKVSRTLGIMLEMNGNQIATGDNKNVRLGKFREACGVNGKPLGALIGQMVRLAIKQKPGYKDPSETVDDIVSFSKA